ncbi:GT2 family glycosyltransferase [Aliiruegeria haliotis]|uniref:GT2 family glycosyltransferase n=1 Tax=Aliiruegeria haliotis TaxID=1280846 RepID=A0A2T0RVJ4_9RHOB|nr:glycosyltransferase [Aliiruegeria haliotis]PRY25168.1 GT2 family glycosyltransferase [Aliiruegeria haliotis]
MEATTQPANMRPRPEDAPAPELPRRLIVAIPSTARRDILTRTVRAIREQTRHPDQLLISVASDGDIDRTALSDLPFPIRVLTGPKGGSPQRNRIFQHLTEADTVLLLDDDFLMEKGYLAAVDALFKTQLDVVMASGTLVADDVSGPGLTHEDGQGLLEDLPPTGSSLTDIHNGYGCNMAFRARPALRNNIRFDEALPLYSWLEDVDFSRRLAPYGRIVRNEATVGVHLGTKVGRSPGRRLGYSQLSNPVYLVGKGTMGRRRALRLMTRNVVSNLVYSIRPRPWTDSRGRLRGNLLAIGDLLRGRLSPARAVDL